MKKFMLLVTFVAFSLLLTSCGPSISVKSDYDPDVNFSAFQTYRWTDRGVPDDELAKNTIVRKRVLLAVNNNLQAKGFVLQEDGDTDMVVVVHGGSKEKMQVHDWGGYYWYDPWWGPYGGRVDVSYYTEGALVIDFVDAKAKELAWRGVGTRVLRDYSSPEKMQQFIDETVDHILAGFPPQASMK
jgi:hypothetical protein